MKNVQNIEIWNTRAFETIQTCKPENLKCKMLSIVSSWRDKLRLAALRIISSAWLSTPWQRSLTMEALFNHAKLSLKLVTLLFSCQTKSV